jgi:nucleoside-diphosphate-sugar epimerase
MHIVVTGASGNLGTQVLAALLAGPDTTVTGISRRTPESSDPRVTWVAADVGDPECERVLIDACRGADAVIHLAWAISPTHDEAMLRRVNVEGTRRVLDAALAAGARAVVHASSVGAYAPREKDTRVDESWPLGVVATSVYSRQKVEVERLLDRYEDRVRVVRMRPVLVLQGKAASEITRYFLGRLMPMTLLRPALSTVVPRIPGLAPQVVHASDVGAAFAAAAARDVHGAFNLAAEPVLDADTLASLLHARTVPVPAAAVRAALDVTWRLRLQPSQPGWLDLARKVPLLDTTRARRELGWQPRYDAGETVRDLLDGMADKGGGATPVLRARPSLRGVASAAGALGAAAARRIPIGAGKKDSGG